MMLIPSNNYSYLNLERRITVLESGDQNPTEETGVTTILELGDYRTNRNYTPTNDPREYSLFFGIIDGNDAPVVGKQYKDVENDHVFFTTIGLNGDKVRITKLDMLISNETGNIRFQDPMYIDLDQNGPEFSSSTDIFGVKIYAKK